MIPAQFELDWCGARSRPLSKGAQMEAILNHLKTGASITPLDALRLFGCFRLGARVWDLKARGHNITAEIVKDPSTGKRYASYKLEA